MGSLKVLNTGTQTTGEMTGTTYGAAISLDGAFSFGAQCNVTVDTPAAQNFLSGVAASKVIQDLTYTSPTRGTGGNSVTVAYTGGGTAGSEVVSVVGNAISIQIQSGVSTATQIRTAFNAVGAATALATCTVSGTGSNAQTTVSAQSLTGGVNSAVNTSTDQVTITSHGFTTGDKGQLTSTGTLPAGLSTSTDYFIIAVDANTIKFASSLANALAGTAIDITDQGSSGATNTFTPTAIAGANVKLQKSNDGTNWSDEGSATNITATGLVYLEKINPTALYMRLAFTLTAGQMNSSNVYVVKGYA